MARRKSGGKKPRFYCETCGREVPPDVEECPYCGMPFYAVMCPQCGYTGKAPEFVEGCPKCGYLGASSMQENVPQKPGSAKSPGKTSSQGIRGRDDAHGRSAVGSREVYPAEEILGEKRSARRNRGKKRERPGWLFFILILILGTLFAGLLVAYLNV